MTVQTFADLGLADPLLHALAAQTFTIPTPIQASAVPGLLNGRDLLGIAQTGSGKTAAFSLPLLQHLMGGNVRSAPFAPRALILAPTRELALQIEDTLRKLGGQTRLRTTIVIGGASRHRQVEAMRRGPDIVVGTPGRICDLMATRELNLGAVRQFVLDEADRMLDLGFIKDIRKIVAALPQDRQSALFSATMPSEVASLANGLLKNPMRVEIERKEETAPKIDQSVHFVTQSAKRALLADLLVDPAFSRVIVFTRTKRGANRVAEDLEDAGHRVNALHGNKSQSQREKALDQFRSGRARVLVATDIAARGIDVTGVSHVINYDLPVEPESYVHRIGRTARAGAAGVAISFCDHAEYQALRAIEKQTGMPLAVASGEPPMGGARNGGKSNNGYQGERAPGGQPARRRRPRNRRPSGGMRSAA